jgi:hypothetical protein
MTRQRVHQIVQQARHQERKSQGMA